MRLSDAVLIRKDPILLKQVRMMAPDFWWIEGWFPNVFFGQHVCSNAYLIKDNQNLVLIDNGRGPVFMEKLVCGVMLEQNCRSTVADDGYARFAPVERVTDEPRDTVPWRLNSAAA